MIIVYLFLFGVVSWVFRGFRSDT